MSEKTIKFEIECPECNGTGVYVGMAERNGAGVVCQECNGTGKYLYSYSYNEFKGRKKRRDVKRVYISGYGYCATTEDIVYDDIGFVAMSKEGVSYKEFLSGKMPKHIKSMVCPLGAYQNDFKYRKIIHIFRDTCWKINGGYIGCFTNCKNFKNKSECWDEFKKITGGKKI